MDLNEIHQVQIARFCQFLKGKSDKAISDRAVEMDDFMADRLPDESAIFNVNDVKTLLLAYHQEAMARVREDLEKAINLSAVFSTQLLAQAQAYGMTLQVEDITIIEDQAHVDQVGSLSAVTSAPPLQPQRRAQLQTMGTTASVDPNVIQELQDLKEENRQLKDRNLKMQGETSGILKERSTLIAELEQVKGNFKQHLNRQAEAAPLGGAGVNVQEYERQLIELREMHDQKYAECEAMRRDMNQRLGDSRQFRELQAIVQKKSEQVRAMQQQLMAHGIMVDQQDDGCIELVADDD